MVYTLGMEHSQLYQKMLQASDKAEETSDCAVIALAIVTDLTYGAVHKLLEQTGRKARSITHRGHINNALDFLDIKTRDVTKQYHTLGAKTIRTLGRVMAGREGIYLAYTHDHILAVKDGVLHDWLAGRTHRIVTILKLRTTHDDRGPRNTDDR